MYSAPDLLMATLAAVAAGAINALAGGGTLLTFPALVALGVPPVAANGTVVVLRKRRRADLAIEDLVRSGTLSRHVELNG